MRREVWIQRYAEIGTWRREFGPSSAPVTVVAASPEMQAVCDLIGQIRDGEEHAVLIHAPNGAGKSTVVSAAIAEFSERHIEYRLVTAGSDPGELMTLLAREGVRGPIVIDNCDKLDPALLRRIVERRRKCGGLLMTAASTSSSLTSQFSQVADHCIVVSPLEDRPADLLLIASVIWEDIARRANLAALCDDSAVEALLAGPHATGAWSLHRVLSEVLSLRTGSEPATTAGSGAQISFGDIAPVLLRMYKESVSHASNGPADAILVVEGDTDEKYFRHAAKLAEERHGWRLLDGLSVRAAAPERSGGASEVGRSLLRLDHDGVPALGLLDYDPPGRSAYEIARRNKLLVIHIPVNFDVLSRNEEMAVVEAEDLLPSELLRRYYENHEEQSPEEWHWRLERLRIVPQGEQKGDLADWVCQVASFEDMERFVFLLVDARRRLHLPCPEAALEKAWAANVRRRQAVRETSVIVRTVSA